MPNGKHLIWYPAFAILGSLSPVLGMDVNNTVLRTIIYAYLI